MAEILDQSALSGLLEMVGGDPDFVDELVDTFLEDAPRQIAEIRAAIAAGSAAGVIRPAHTIKGSSASLGAGGMEMISRSIEEQARSGSLEGLPEHLAELERALAEAATELADARARRWLRAGPA
jgi:HPt (histidine-containing phosphotransfer) domain-containing protein